MNDRLTVLGRAVMLHPSLFTADMPRRPLNCPGDRRRRPAKGAAFGGTPRGSTTPPRAARGASAARRRLLRLAAGRVKIAAMSDVGFLAGIAFASFIAVRLIELRRPVL